MVITNCFLPRLLPMFLGQVYKNSTNCKHTSVTCWDSSYWLIKVNVSTQASNVIHFFRMHNITSVFLLCKLFLLLFISFPFLVLGYLGHLQPVGHLPVGMKRTASTQPAHTRSQKCWCRIHATLRLRLIQKFQKHPIRYYNNHRNVVDSFHYCIVEHLKLLHCEKHIRSNFSFQKLGYQQAKKN